MATTYRSPWDDEDDALTSSVFQQQPQQTSPWGSTLTSTPKPAGTGTTSRALSSQAMAQGLPGGPLNYASLVGAPATNAAPPSTAAPASFSPVNHATYAPPGGQSAEDFFRGLQPGTAVAEQPGQYWIHNGQGWGWSTSPAAQGPSAGQPQGDPRFSWMQSKPYTPGAIGTDDLPGFSYEDLLQQMGPDYMPTTVQGGNYQSQDVSPDDFATYDFGGWSGLPGYDVGAVGDDTDALIRQILAHPESLDERTIAMMKGASREEQSALAGQADEEMRALGYDMGIEDSPWMAAERLQGRRDRDAAVIASNRNIETEAAKTNAGDRRAAAALGASYSDAKGRLKLAQRGQEFSEQAEGERNKQTSTASKQARAQYLTGIKTDNANRALEAAKVRMQADISNNDNLFKAATLRKDKVLGTIDADLRRAAATTDRLSLIEQASQAAADLGISRDKLMADWLKAQMDDLTQRYGIDVAKEVDLKKLDQAGIEFQADLAARLSMFDKDLRYKYDALDQNNEQFGYGLGLSYGQLFENARQHDDDMYARSQGF